MTVDLTVVLRDLGVFTLSREKRTALAAELAADGATVEDVQRLHRYLDSVLDDKAKVQRTVAAHLICAAGRKAMFEDLAKREAAQVSSVREEELVDPPGQGIRLADNKRVRTFEKSWEEYLAAKKNGTLPPIENPVILPWEQRLTSPPDNVS